MFIKAKAELEAAVIATFIVEIVKSAQHSGPMKRMPEEMQRENRAGELSEHCMIHE